MLIWRTDRVRPAPAGWGCSSTLATRAGSGCTTRRSRSRAPRSGSASGTRIELDARQFRAVVRLAAEQTASVGVYWQDLTNALADYTGGNALVGEATPRLAALLRADDVPVRTAVPRAGRRARPPGSCSRARHPGCMYRWLDYIVSAKANAASARYLGEAPATPAACAYMSCRAVHAGDEPGGHGCRSGARRSTTAMTSGDLRRLVPVVGRLGADPGIVGTA